MRKFALAPGKFLLGLFALVLVFILVATVFPAPASAAGPTYYVVRRGDTLASIAARYGVSAWTIARANRLWNPNFIYVGQTLYIPYVPGPYPAPRPFCLVRVNYGDTLSSIAARLHTDVRTLARVNGIYNVNWIFAGQWLRVPNCKATTTTTPTPTPTAAPPPRRDITGNWSSGPYVLQLAQAAGCAGSNCAIQGQFFEGASVPAVPVNGTLDLNSGAVSITIPANAPGGATRYLTGTLSANSASLSGQLTGVGAVTFTKQ